MVRKDDWNDFNFLKFFKTRFMAQDVIYSGEGSVCTWEKREVDCTAAAVLSEECLCSSENLAISRDVLCCHSWKEVLPLACNRQRPGRLLNILQSTGQPHHNKKMTPMRTSIVLRLRNSRRLVYIHSLHRRVRSRASGWLVCQCVSSN